MSLATWFLQRRLRKELRLSKEEYGMFKKMFLDNWFSTLGGIALAAFDALNHGVSLKTALITAVGLVLKDNIPGIRTSASGPAGNP